MYTEKTFCPYRICPLGAHVDHQLGLVTGFALDHGIELEYEATEDGTFNIQSENYPGEIKFALNDLPDRRYDWSDFAVGAAVTLSKKYALKRGFNGNIKGNLPAGGISSSAAVIIVYLLTICKVNNIELTRPQLVAFAIDEERNYIGVKVGKLDQSCEIYCRKDQLLYLDTKDDSMELIPRNPHMPDFKICIVFSGVSRKLANSAYNLRVDECKAASYALQAYAGLDYGKYEESVLRDVPRGVYEQYKEKLPLNWRKRAQHYYSENDRVKKGIKAWREGNIEAFGQLICESGNSSIYQYEAGSEPLKALSSILSQTDGVYGARFSGAGFNGCSMAIVNPEKENEIRERVTNEYGKLFPEYMDTFDIIFCETSNGAMI